MSIRTIVVHRDLLAQLRRSSQVTVFRVAVLDDEHYFIDVMYCGAPDPVDVIVAEWGRAQFEAS